MTQFDQVSVLKKANVFFDGKCVSHTVICADGSKKTLGLIFPSNLKFSTKAAEIMEITAGHCRVRMAGESAWIVYQAGQEFHVAADSNFDIETDGLLEYVCHFV